MKKTLMVVLAIVVCLAIVAGCTSNQAAPATSSAPAASSAAPAASSVAPSESAAASVSASTSAAGDEWAPLEKKLEEKRIQPAKTGKEPKPTTKKKLKVGFMPTAMNTHYNIVIAGAQEQAASYGDGVIELVVQAPTSQSANVEQVSICQTWIEQGFDAICIAVSNDEMMTPVFKEAAEKGIPVFLFNTPQLLTSNPYFVSTVGYYQYEGGYTFGKYLAEKYKDQNLNIVFMRGLPGTHDSERAEGFYDASGAVSAANAKSTTNGRHPNFKVVAEPTGDWARAPAQVSMESVLQTQPKIDLLFADYDEMALGALVSIKAANRLKEIKIYGYDNTPDAFASMEAKEMYGTTDTVPKQMGIDTIKTMVDYCMNGKDVPKAVWQKCRVWDWDNMAQFDKNNYIWVKK